jgi:hypothetical protein
MMRKRLVKPGTMGMAAGIISLGAAVTMLIRKSRQK